MSSLAHYGASVTCSPFSLCLSSPTVQVLGVHGVRHAGRLHQHGLGLPHADPVPLRAALQYLPGQAPLALFHRRTRHTGYLQNGALPVLAGVCGTDASVSGRVFVCVWMWRICCLRCLSG